MPSCPHCSATIEPPPKRSRNCPHCRKPIVIRRGQLLTPESAEAFDADLGAERKQRKAKEARERFQQGRRSAIAAIKVAKQSGVVIGFKPVVSDDACEVCLFVRGRFFPIEKCTGEMLPPYENCQLEGGCESTFSEVLDTDIRDSARLRRQQESRVRVRKSLRIKPLGFLLLLALAYLCWKLLF